MEYIKYFSDISLKDIDLVGEKSALLCQIAKSLKNLNFTNGFSITVKAYLDFLKKNNLINKIKDILIKTDINNVDKNSRLIKKLILSSNLEDNLITEVAQAYKFISNIYNKKSVEVAVRSSVLYLKKDKENYSFSGQQDSYLNILNLKNLLNSIKSCIASLFNSRAIIYREENNIDHFDILISIIVEKMIRSDKSSSGIILNYDIKSGFKDILIIESSYGLGQNLTRGKINPDEFHIYKQNLIKKYSPIIKKHLGSKEKKLIYSKNSVKNVSVKKIDRLKFSLSSEEIIDLSNQAITIENYFYNIYKKYNYINIEWAKDGLDNKFYITEVSIKKNISKKENSFEIYKLNNLNEKFLLKGLSVGHKIVSGKAKIIKDFKDFKNFENGDILVTDIIDPELNPIVKKASAVITNQGGRTSHSAIIIRDLSIPAIFGTVNATKVIKDGDIITLDCSQGITGYIYSGNLKFKFKKLELDNLPEPKIDLFLNTSESDKAYELSFLPVKGVGLIRSEFIIADKIKIHPLAILNQEKIINKKILKSFYKYNITYENLENFFVEVLAENVAIIAAAFYPREVVLRFTDFKSNEYRNLIAGKYFEPLEENPALGFRGASRYYSQDYSKAFELECKAVKKVRDIMGFKNLKVIVPFVRTVKEAENIINILKKHNLKRFEDDLKIFMTCEIPSNILLLEEFSKFFDGFSIGSNDLTQLTIAVDRDSDKLAYLFDENNKAVKIFIKMAIEKAKENNKYISISGQAPSDYKEIADFLIENKIDSISLNPDSVIPFILKHKK